jgi:hypothetical protein
MSFPRVTAIMLALTGSVWAFFLGRFLVATAMHRPVAETPGTSLTAILIVTLIVGPGLLEWYGYIRRAFGRSMFGARLSVWPLSVVINLLYLFSMDVSDPKVRLGLKGWLMAAIVLSAAAWLKEPKVPVVKSVVPVAPV